MSTSTNTVVYFDWKTNLYLRLQTMSHIIYAAKFKKTIIHQHVHLRRESQSHEPAHVLMRLYPIARLLTKRKKEVMVELIIVQRPASGISFLRALVLTHTLQHQPPSICQIQAFQ